MSIDEILFELKSKEINFCPNEIPVNGDKFVIILSSRINFSTLGLKLNEHSSFGTVFFLSY